jgi:hypothetical protein
MKKNIFLLLTVAFYSYTGMAQTVLTKSGKQVTIDKATTTAVGTIQLAGDLGGTANAPTIKDNTITTAKIVDGTVTNTDLNTGVGGIYKGSGSLTNDTNVTQGTNILNFTSTATTGTSQFTVDGTTLNVDAVNNRVGIGTATPANTIEITQGTSGNSGLRFTNLNSASAATTSSTKVLGLNSTGDVILANVPGTENVVTFSTATPTTSGVVFTPNTPTDSSVIYQSATDNSLWTYNGTTYVTYTPPSSTAWNLSNSSNDAGSNKTSGIWRSGSIGIGTATPTNKLEIAQGTSGNSGLRFTNLNSASAATTSSTKVLGLNSTGDVILTNVPGTENVVTFSTATPTTSGVVFTPNTPSDKTIIYQSLVDNSLWTYNGTTYVTYVPPATTAWNLINTSNDAGSNKTSSLWRSGGIITGGDTTSKVFGNLTAIGRTNFSGIPAYKTASIGYLNNPTSGWNGSGLLLTNSTAGSEAFSMIYNGDNLYMGKLSSSNGITQLGLLNSTGMNLGGSPLTPPLSRLNVFGGASIGSYAGVNAAPTNGLIVSGNVGVGAASPITNLHVATSVLPTNTINADAKMLRLQRPINTGVKWDNIAQFNLGSYAVMGASQAATRLDLAMNDGGDTTINPVMTWQANGRVGIGTTAPSQSLEVVGGAKIDGTTFNIDSVNDRVGMGTATPSTNLHINTSLLPTNTVNADAQVLRFQRPINTGVKWDNIAQFNLGSYAVTGSSQAATRLDLAMNDGGDTTTNPVMTWNANGNIGIGTTAPTEKLDVVGNIKFSGALKPGGTSGTAGQVLTSQGTGTPTWTTLTTASNIYSADGTLSGTRTVAQDINNLNFTSTATSGTSHFTVDGTTLNVDAVNNKVGIGTATPSTKLQVSGGSGYNYLAVGEATGTTVKVGRESFKGYVGFYNSPSDVDPEASISYDHQFKRLLIDTNAFNSTYGYVVSIGNGNGNNSTARLGINTITPQHIIQVGNAGGSGQGAFVSDAGVWTNVSDRRLKHNIVDASYGLNEVLQLRPVQYEMNLNDEKQIGFIAQEVKKVVPEVVSGTEGDLNKNQILGLSYGNLVPVLVNGIKEQQKMIDELKKESNAQQKLLLELKAEIELLKKK